MALKQYIGARYVTKIYENSLDPHSAEWEADVNYEPLTMVTFNFGSYLSKKEVPATVGNPSDNPSYWVQTGFYNGQIAYLYDQVGEINRTLSNINQTLSGLSDDVDTLEGTVENIVAYITRQTTKRYVVISDSYGTASAGGTPWTEQLQTLLGVASANYFTFSEGAMGFNRESHSGRTVQELIEYHASDITEHSTITDFIIALGANDTLAVAQTGLLTAIENCIDYIKSNYVNADIYIGFIGNVAQKPSTTSTPLYLNTISVYKEACNDKGVKFINGAEYILHNCRLLGSDGVHPNANGSTELARYINGFINGSVMNYTYRGVCTFKAGSYLIEGSTITVTIDGPVTKVEFNIGNFTEALTVPAAPGLLDLGEIDDPVFYGAGDSLSDSIAYLYSGGSSDYKPFILIISAGHLYVVNTSTSTDTLPPNARQAYPITATFETLTI